MKAEIIGIGTEILLGKIVNTNSAYLSKKLAEAGIDCYFHTTVGDNQNRLFSALEQALSRADIIITTGGLGPTVDDITLDIVSRVLTSPLVYKKEIANLINTHFKRRRIKMPKDNLRQAYIPKNAKWFKNSAGTAPGILAKTGKKTLIALPGPPREMQPMFEQYILPFIKKSLNSKYVIISRTLKTTGLAESQLHEKIKSFLEISGSVTVGIYAHPSQVDLKITAKAKNAKSAKKMIDSVEKKLRAKLKHLVFGVDEKTLEQEVVRLLKKNTLAVAESCTGGLVSNRLTDVPGVSKNLLLSIVAYSNKAKTELLDISEKALKLHGAVSAETAKKMAANIRKLSNADIGISTTGIAGPSGSGRNKPVGLVYIALSSAGKIMVKKRYFAGTRRIIKYRSSQAALDMLRLHLLNNKL